MSFWYKEASNVQTHQASVLLANHSLRMILDTIRHAKTLHKNTTLNIKISTVDNQQVYTGHQIAHHLGEGSFTSSPRFSPVYAIGAYIHKSSELNSCNHQNRLECYMRRL